ncbi:hypothetical protein HanIR_Chr09g0420851 [Helianthus annuus]|nr:hypothetical protein HanIR_Chr09g0420851 [Helianthus annuus]
MDSANNKLPNYILRGGSSLFTFGSRSEETLVFLKQPPHTSRTQRTVHPQI